MKKSERSGSTTVEAIVLLIEGLCGDDRSRLCELLHTRKMLECPARRCAEQTGQVAPLPAEQQKGQDEFNSDVNAMCESVDGLCDSAADLLDLVLDFHRMYRESRRGPDREMDEILEFVEHRRTSDVPMKRVLKEVNERWPGPDGGKRYASVRTFSSTISTAKKVRQKWYALLASLEDCRNHFRARRRAPESGRKPKGESMQQRARDT